MSQTIPSFIYNLSRTTLRRPAASTYEQDLLKQHRSKVHRQRRLSTRQGCIQTRYDARSRRRHYHGYRVICSSEDIIRSSHQGQDDGKRDTKQRQWLRNETTDYEDEDRDLLDFDYRKHLSTALKNKEPDLAARCLLSAHRANDQAFLTSISQADFTQVLQLIEPTAFLGEVLDLRYSMSSAAAINFCLTPLEQIAVQFGDLMKKLMTIRTQSGHKLTLTDLENILNAAKELHLADLAKYVWSILEAGGYKLSAKCYTAYAGSAFWRNPINDIWSFRRRHVARTAEIMEERILDEGYHEAKDGILNKSQSVFDEMVRKGVFPDANSYGMLLSSAGYEGKLDKIETILKNIWGIDMLRIRKNANEVNTPPRRLEKDDSLYPTSQLLYDVLHAYCINNEISSAYKILDYFHKHYDVKLDRKHWHLLIRWIHVLAAPHRRREWQKQMGLGASRIDTGVLRAMWQVMTSEPYKVEPTLPMLDLYVRNIYATSQSWTDMLPIMEQGRKLYNAEGNTRKRLLTQLRELTLRNDENKYEQALACTGEGQNDQQALACTGEGQHDQQATMKDNLMISIEHTRRANDLASLKCLQGRNYIFEWVRKCLDTTKKSSNIDYDAQRSARDVPNFIQSWCLFCPTFVEYTIPTGHVILELRSSQTSKLLRNYHTTKAREEAAMLARSNTLIDAKWIINREDLHHAASTGFQHNREKQYLNTTKRRKSRTRPGLRKLHKSIDDQKGSINF